MVDNINSQRWGVDGECAGKGQRPRRHSLHNQRTQVRHGSQRANQPTQVSGIKHAWYFEHRRAHTQARLSNAVPVRVA